MVDSPLVSASLPSGPGAYVLELLLPRRVTIHPGALGRVQLGPGLVRYYGSARGPGGIRARVARHLRSTGRRSHWHVDALTARATVVRLLVRRDATECALVRRDLSRGGWKVAVPGFGSSDCGACPAHLLVRPR